eukprot:13908905-Alexandrium_andersonii.AAC.1
MSAGCLHTCRQLHWRCVGIEVAVRPEQCAWMQRAWVLTTLASVSEQVNVRVVSHRCIPRARTSPGHWGAP